MLCTQQTKLDEAEKRYRAAAERYPGSFSAPRAMLGLGACYEEMNRPNDAKAAYEKLVADYGSSDLVKDAEARMKRLAQASPAVDTTKEEQGGEGGAPVE
jgi:TolA-binding protein